LEANATPAPEIPGMAPANFFGGSIANAGGFDRASTSAAASARATPLPASVSRAPTPGIAVGGGAVRRIAPTPVNPLTGNPVGFGDTLETAMAHAMTLTVEQRQTTRARLQTIIAALDMADVGERFKVEDGQVKRKTREELKTSDEVEAEEKERTPKAKTKKTSPPVEIEDGKEGSKKRTKRKRKDDGTGK
jgi:hypothetical protein